MNKYGMSLVGLLLLCTMEIGYAQTCNDRIQTTTPDSRFEVSGNEVTDLQTGLIWQRCSVGQSWGGSSCSGVAITHTWSQALVLASGDWRLPNFKELNSIVETACVNASINLTIFPRTVNSVYWSSSTYVGNSSNLWGVNFSGGGSSSYPKSGNQYVRLVRGGQ